MQQSQAQAPPTSIQMTISQGGVGPAGGAAVVHTDGSIAYNGKTFTTSWYEQWTDCFKEMDTCCLACWCPCVVYGNNGEKISNTTSILGCLLYTCGIYFCGCIGSCVLGGMNRNQMRIKYNITTGDCADDSSDYLIHCFCSCCALAQEARELKYRADQPLAVGGYGMGVGPGGAAAAAPPPNYAMGGQPQPQPGYGQPQPAYGQPQPGYGQPQPVYVQATGPPPPQGQAVAYGQQPYGQQQVVYAQPAPGPAPVYVQQPPTQPVVYVANDPYAYPTKPQ